MGPLKSLHSESLRISAVEGEAQVCSADSHPPPPDAISSEPHNLHQHHRSCRRGRA